MEFVTVFQSSNYVKVEILRGDDVRRAVMYIYKSGVSLYLGQISSINNSVVTQQTDFRSNVDDAAEVASNWLMM